MIQEEDSKIQSYGEVEIKYKWKTKQQMAVERNVLDISMGGEKDPYIPWNGSGEDSFLKEGIDQPMVVFTGD